MIHTPITRRTLLAGTAAFALQAWAVQGNSALANYYWAASGDYNNGHFSDPVKRIDRKSVV